MSSNDSGAEVIDIALRDADVELSPSGSQQAEELGNWLREQPVDVRPDSVWCSPYVRAQQTAKVALETCGLDVPFRLDERLRDRDLGVLDLLTSAGVDAKFPEEAERRRWLGKFYYRPPGGESWADLALRIRTLITDLDRIEDGNRVLVVCHDAMILIFRYVCEGLSEEEVLEIARSALVRNASVTRLSRSSGEGEWEIDGFNEAPHLEAHGAPVAEQPGGTDAVAR